MDMSKVRFSQVKAIFLCGAALGSFGQSAHAQVADGEREQSTTQLQEIIVTAQRRGENLQDVPLAVSSITAETLAQTGINNIRDLAQVEPALNIGTGSGAVLPFLRGIGNPSGFNVGNEASVPVYIDDVYYTRLAPSYLDLANVERVEVLKGPQGTLFGRNASGGLIHVITREPGRNTELDARLGYANYDTWSGKLYAATPLGESAAADVAVTALKQNDGWGKNLINGTDTYRNKFINVRSKLIVEPTDTTKLRLSGFYAYQKTGQGLQQSIYEGTFAATDPIYGPSQVLEPAGFYDVFGYENAYLRHEGWGLSLKVDQELGFADFSSITAYRKAKELYQAAINQQPQPYVGYHLNAVDRQISQELQLKSKASSNINWIVGFYYLNSRQGYDPTRVFGDAFGNPTADPALPYLDLIGIQTIKSYSGYGQATFPVVDDKTNITLGLRYTSDDVHGAGRQRFFTGEQAIVNPGTTDYQKTVNFKKLTYKVAIDHHFSNEFMTYASISRGYKSGTFNTLPLDTDPSRPETVESYEIGFKSELFGRRVRLNGAIFQNDISNPQVATVITRDGRAFVGLTNAEKAKIKGAELSVEGRITSELSLRGAATYLDAKYTDFENAPYFFPINNFECPTSVPTRGTPNPSTVTVPTIAGLCNAILGDGSGNRMAQVPDWRISVGANYELRTEHGNFILDAGLAYTSSFPWDADNIITEKAYTLVNASLTYELPGDRISIQFWAKNLTNVQHYSTELPVAGAGGSTSGAAAPRTYGLELRYKM